MNMSSKIQNILLWVGTAGAIIFSVAYLIIIMVLINGFEVDMQITQMIGVAILGWVTGTMISVMLRGQGIAFASNDTNSKKVMNDYHKAINKTKTVKQMRTIKWHVLWGTLSDVFIKGATTALSTFFIMYIFIEGNGNWGLLGMAIANLFMFISFGLIAMSKGFDKYMNEHIPVIIEITNKINDERASVHVKEDNNGEIQEHKLPIVTTTSGEE